MGYVCQKKEIRIGKKSPYKINIETYDSTAELVAQNARRKITSSKFKDVKKTSFSSDFEGCRDYDEACSLLRDGWTSGVARLQKAIGEVRPPRRKAFEFRVDACGFAPIVPSALLGLPNSMMTSIATVKRTKTISILYDMTLSCFNEPPVFEKNGAALLKVVLQLEQQGYRVELNVIQGYTDENSADCLVVRVKNANQFLDLKRISFPVAHSAFFRAIGFDWYSKFPIGTYRDAYGKAFCYAIGDADFYNGDEFQELIEKAFGNNSIYISGVDIQSHDVGYIVDTLKRGKSDWKNLHSKE